MNPDEESKVVKEFGNAPFDLHIKIKDNIFKLHRNRIVPLSNYFKQILVLMNTGSFSKSNAASEVQLQEIPADVFDNICNYLYGKQLHLTSCNLCRIWTAAKILQIKDLIQRCENFVQTLNGSSNNHLRDRKSDNIEVANVTEQNLSLHDEDYVGLAVEDLTIVASKQLLMNNSNYIIKRLIKMKERPVIRLKQKDPVALSKVLIWMKKGQCKLSLWDVVNVAKIAYLFRLQPLLQQCCDFVKNLLADTKDRLTQDGVVSAGDCNLLQQLFQNFESDFESWCIMASSLLPTIAKWEIFPNSIVADTRNVQSPPAVHSNWQIFTLVQKAERKIIWPIVENQLESGKKPPQTSHVTSAPPELRTPIKTKPVKRNQLAEPNSKKGNGALLKSPAPSVFSTISKTKPRSFQTPSTI